MRRLMILTATLALAAPLAGVQAQTMYKCVGADGRTSYGDQPCRGKVVATKELDVRANLEDIERANRKQAERLERERLQAEQRARNADAASSEQAKQTEKQLRLMEGSAADRSLAQYEQLKADTQKRVKADEEQRAEASRLWNCRRGPEPEKCQ